MNWLERAVLILVTVLALMEGSEVRDLQDEIGAMKLRVFTLEADQGTIINFILGDQRR